jgi:hypothetical protein
MAIFDLFSKRQKRLRGDVPELYVYDTIPNPLRVQVIYIVKEAVGIDRVTGKSPEGIYEALHKILCKEYGIFSLTEEARVTDQGHLFNFFLSTTNNDKALDIIELFFRWIDSGIRKDQYYEQRHEVKINPTQAIEELNERFKEHGVGYQFDGGEIIKLDSTYTHSEIVKPVIALLWNKKFLGANEEYLKAHEHYRHGRNKEALAEGLKAFESTMKIICKEKGWAYNQTDPAKKLIQICFQNNLVPSFTQNQFTSLQNLLESGIPTIRNKLGGHGQGQELQKVDDEMTRYGLNLTGANIIFLVEQSGIK